MENLLILGCGGYGRVVAETARLLNKFKEIDFLDDGGSTFVRGRCDQYTEFLQDYHYAYPAFGDNQLRMQWMGQLKTAGFSIPTLIHPEAYVSPSAQVAEGVVILPKSVVQTNAHIETGCLINIGALVDHDCQLKTGIHVCLGAIVKSGTIVDSGVRIEAGKVWPE